MNRIYLDKLCDFALTTYKNYEHITKNFDFGDYVNNIKQNQSLNEKGIFLKHNFVELKTLISDNEYDQMVLINPLCFNLSGNTEWFNFLNALLTVLNDNYSHESNLIKKTILETADKTFRKKITLSSNCIDDNIINSVCVLTNITLILLNDQYKTRLFNHGNKTNKIVVMFNLEKEYYCILNWNQKYYNADSHFITYLIDQYDNTEINQKNKNTQQEFINVVNKKKKKNTTSYNNGEDADYVVDDKNKIKKSFKLNNNNIFDCNNDIENIPNDNLNQTFKSNNNNDNSKNNTNMTKDENKGMYKELHADENYAMYISEIVDNNNNNNGGTNIVGKKENISAEKKKKKNNKNIFMTNKKEINTSEQVKNKSNGIIGKEVGQECNEQQSSVFNKTEKLDIEEIEKICNEIKISMGLEIIQANALRLGLNIVEGSTKSGKPKNKTKSELIEQIKEFSKNIQK